MMNYQKKKEVYFFISYIGNFWGWADFYDVTYFSLPNCHFFAVTNFSLSNCLFCELTKLSLPNCCYQIVTLSNCHYQIVITKLSSPKIRPSFWDDSLIAWIAKFSSFWLVVHRTISIKIKLTKIQCDLDIHSTRFPTLGTLFYNAVDSKGYFFQLMDIPHIALVLFIYWIQGLLQGGF